MFFAVFPRPPRRRRKLHIHIVVLIAFFLPLFHEDTHDDFQFDSSHQSKIKKKTEARPFLTTDALMARDDDHIGLRRFSCSLLCV